MDSIKKSKTSMESYGESKPPTSKNITESIFILSGSFMAALGIHMVADVNTLTAGGTGVAMIIHEATGYPWGLGTLVFLVNFVVFLIGVIVWQVRKRYPSKEPWGFIDFAVKTLVSMGIILAVMWILERLLPAYQLILPNQVLFTSIGIAILSIALICTIKGIYDDSKKSFSVTWIKTIVMTIRMIDIFVLVGAFFLSTRLDGFSNIAPSALLIGGGISFVNYMKTSGGSSGGTDTLSNILERCVDENLAMLIMRGIDFIILIIAFFVFRNSLEMNPVDMLLLSFPLVAMYGICAEQVRNIIRKNSKEANIWRGSMFSKDDFKIFIPLITGYLGLLFIGFPTLVLILYPVVISFILIFVIKKRSDSKIQETIVKYIDDAVEKAMKASIYAKTAKENALKKLDKYAFIKFSDKSSYWGQIDENGEAKGYGCIINEDEEYYGDVLNGNAHGYGVLTTGHLIYKGQFLHGLPHGYGQLINNIERKSKKGIWEFSEYTKFCYAEDLKDVFN